MDRIKGLELTGAEIVVRCLQEEGVDTVFGYPGGAVLHIYDALFKQDKVRHVLVRHEQGAAHAADGYSRSSHKVGVCRPLLVANENVLDLVVLEQLVVDVEDRAARIPEDVLDALLLEAAHDDLGAGDLAGFDSVHGNR